MKDTVFRILLFFAQTARQGWVRPLESARAKEQRRLDLADFASACRLLLVGKIKNKF